MSAVPVVSLDDLTLSDSGIADQAYSTAAELLAVGLSRHGAVVLRLAGKAQGAALKAGLTALLGGGTRSLPGCELREWRVGGPQDAAAVEEAYGTLESAARLVLAALCRSSLLRLRSDAFSGFLDDLPHSRSFQGSSVLVAKAFLDNFTHLTAEEGAAVLPLFADPQDAVSERGLLSLFHGEEAKDPAGDGVLSGMQVQDSQGRWQDVQLGPNEVAVVAGHTLQHATAGLLKAAPHRIIGAPFKPPTRRANGRTTLHFELRPRPAAVLDLRSQLEAAGHAVSSRFSPMSVSSLLEQFESLLSPAAKVATPDQQQGAAAHAAWEELQARQAKKSKRRSSAAAASDASGSKLPGTRSGRARRSVPAAADKDAGAAARDGEGMDWQEGGQQGRRRSSGGASRRPTSAGSDGGSRFSLGSAATGGRRTSLEPASSAALVVMRGRACICLEGCLTDDPAQCITLCVRSFTGMERWFYCNKSVRCGAIFEMYCARLGIQLGAVKFMLRGTRIFGASTPESLNMCDGDELSAVPESSDRLRQQRELGPLFSAVFGSAAAASFSSKLELV